MKLRYLLTLLISIGLHSAAAADHHKTVDLPGVWNAMASTDSDVREIKWTFKKEGGKITGVSLDLQDDSERNLDRITVKEKTVTLEIDIEQDGNKGLIKVVAEEKSPGKLVGKWSVEDLDGTEYLSGDITAKKEVQFAGEWDAVSILNDGNTLESVFKLSGKNSALKGSIDGNNGNIEIDKAKVDDDSIRLEFDFDYDGNTINAVIEAESKGTNQLEGKWIVVNDSGDEVASGDWKAKRKSKGLAGKWNVVAKVPDADDYNGVLTLNAEDGKYSGTSQRNDGEARKLTSIKVDGKNIELTIDFESGGNTGVIKIVAKQQDDGSLKGEWVLTGSDDQEYARESWVATRQ